MDDELAATIEAIILGQGYADAERWKAGWKQLHGENIQRLFTALAERDDISDRLGEIRVPALVVHGDQRPRDQRRPGASPGIRACRRPAGHDRGSWARLEPHPSRVW